MSDRTVTLRGFFDDTPVTAHQLEALGSRETLTSLRAVLAKRAPDVTWSAAFAEVMKQTDDLLDVAIPELVVAAWIKARMLHRYADAQRSAPNETAVVPLVTHTVRSVHAPYVELLVGDAPVGRVDFEIDVEVTLEGARVSIRGGRVVEARIGSCQGRGSVSCEGKVIAERAAKPFLLPDVMPLREPVSIDDGPDPRT